MAFDTFIVYVGVYSDVDAAEADYDLVKDLHTEAGLIDAYDAAVIHRREDNKVKIVQKRETPDSRRRCTGRRSRTGNRSGRRPVSLRRAGWGVAGGHHRGWAVLVGRLPGTPRPE